MRADLESLDVNGSALVSGSLSSSHEMSVHVSDKLKVTTLGSVRAGKLFIFSASLLDVSGQMQASDVVVIFLTVDYLLSPSIRWIT